MWREDSTTLFHFTRVCRYHWYAGGYGRTAGARGPFEVPMMPLHQSPVDVRIVSTPKPRTTGMSRHLVPAPGPALAESESLHRELVRLDAENARLAEEIKRLRDENQNLRDSAAIWIRLYERQLGRANDAIRGSGSSAQTPRRSSNPEPLL
jgi:hypothetical protein